MLAVRSERPGVCLAPLLAALAIGCGKSRSVPDEPSGPDSPTPFTVTWFEGFGGSESDFPFQLSAGGAEQVTIVGTSAGRVDWGQGVLTPEDGFAPFVVALNGAGESVFAAMARVSDDQGHVAVSADRAGGSVMVGSFGTIIASDETLAWGDLQLVAPTPGRPTAYVVRLGADGVPIWGRAFAAGSAFSLPSVALDLDGHVLWAGSEANDADFGGGQQSGDAFLVKLDPTGQLVWSRIFNKSESESHLATLGVAVDSVGNSVLLGIFSSPVDFGNGPLDPAEGGDIFVAKFDADGDLLWSRGAGGWRGGAMEGGIAVGPNDEIAVAAPFDEAATFGAPRDRDSGSGNVLVAKLEADGTPSFIRRAGGVLAAAIAIDDEGRIVITGTGSPEGLPEPFTESQPGFVLAYDTSGRMTRYLWLTGDSVFPASVAAIEDGNLFVTGRFGDDVTANDQTLFGAGGFDCYVGRLEP